MAGRVEIAGFSTTRYSTKPVSFASPAKTWEISVAETRLTSRGDRGIVTSRFEIINQRGEVAVEGTEKLMIICKPE